MQLQLIAAQGPAQFAFQIGQAAGVAVDAFVKDMKGAALSAFGLLHRDMSVPHQRIGTGTGPCIGNPQAAADQQAFAIDPIGLGQGFGNALGHPFGTLRRTADVDQQRKFVTAQPRQLIARFQLALEPRDHLQDQSVAGLVAQRVVGVTEIVEIQVPKRETAAFIFSQTRRQ